MTHIYNFQINFVDPRTMHTSGASLVRSQGGSLTSFGKGEQYSGQQEFNTNNSFSVIMRSNESVGSTSSALSSDISLHRHMPSNNRSLLNMGQLRSNDGLFYSYLYRIYY